MASSHSAGIDLEWGWRMCASTRVTAALTSLYTLEDSIHAAVCSCGVLGRERCLKVRDAHVESDQAECAQEVIWTPLIRYTTTKSAYEQHGTIILRHRAPS